MTAHNLWMKYMHGFDRLINYVQVYHFGSCISRDWSFCLPYHFLHLLHLRLETQERLVMLCKHEFLLYFYLFDFIFKVWVGFYILPWSQN